MSTHCQRSYTRKCQRRGVGAQKSQNFVNVIFERALRTLLGISLGHLLLVASKNDRFIFTLELETQ